MKSTTLTNMFIDTSAWLAYYSKQDSNHTQILTIINQYLENNKTIYTSNYVLCETITRLNTSSNWYFTSNFISFFNSGVKSGSIKSFWLSEQDEIDSIKLMEKYSDHRLSLTDATIAFLVKKHRLKAVVTTDDHFDKIGLTVLPNRN